MRKSSLESLRFGLAVVLVVIGCSSKSAHVESPPANRADRTTSADTAKLPAPSEELEVAVRELTVATDALRQHAAMLNEFTRELAVAGTESDGAVGRYPDESLSLDIEKDGKLAGWTVADSSGYVKRVGDNDSEVQLTKRDIAAVFTKLRHLGTNLAADSDSAMPIVRVQTRLLGDETRLTYRKRAGREKFTIRCSNDKNVPFSQDCEDVIRTLCAGKTEAAEGQAEPAVPAAQARQPISSEAAAISNSVGSIRDATSAIQRLLPAIELFQRSGDLSAEESVSYEFQLPQVTGTITLDSNGWLTIHDGVAPDAVIIPYCESKIREALDKAREIVERIAGADRSLIPVKVVRNFYKQGHSFITYRNRRRNLTYRFECMVEGEAAASPEFDRIISILYSTAAW